VGCQRCHAARNTPRPSRRISRHDAIQAVAACAGALIALGPRATKSRRQMRHYLGRSPSPQGATQ